MTMPRAPWTFAAKNSPGSNTATEFVGWYNRQPHYRDCALVLWGKVAVIVGNGKVALHVSRKLAKTPSDLVYTGVAAHALDALAQSRITDIHIIGRPLNGEIVSADIIVRSKTIDGTGELNLALLDHIGALRDQTGEMHILLRQQNRNAGRSDVNYCLRDLLDDFGREAFGGLVQKNERGGSHECARDG